MEFVDAFVEKHCVELMDVDALAEAGEQEDGEFAAEVLAKLVETGEHAACAHFVGPVERGVIGLEAEPSEN